MKIPNKVRSLSVADFNKNISRNLWKINNYFLFLSRYGKVRVVLMEKKVFDELINGYKKKN